MFHEFELILWSCHAASPKLQHFVGNVTVAKQRPANLNTSDVIFERVQTHLLHTAFFVKQSQMEVKSEIGNESAYEALLSASFPNFAS